MNTQKLKLILLPVLVAVLISSCNKDETDANNRVYLDDITGTYSGEFTSETNQVAKPGTAVVTKTDDDELQIHCYGEIMDTTFIMDAYENGDSVMLCNIGDDFYNEYGQMGNGYHMMDMGMGQSEWMHHMEENHQEGDEHYGGFNMMEGSFEYTFRKMHNNSLQSIHFNGFRVHR